MKGAKGFTLTELIIVIIILGILGALIVPRFSALDSEARVSAVTGIAGALRSASAIAHGTALVDGTANDATATVDMEGNVTLAYGYPAGSTGGIMAAIGYTTTVPGFTVSLGAASTFTPETASTAATCQAIYTAATSATVPASVTEVTSGC